MTALRSGDDFLALLGACEQRLAVVGRRRSRMRWTQRVILVGSFAAMILLAGGVLSDRAAATPFAVALLAVPALLAVASWAVLIRPTGRELSAQEQAMLVDVDRLREVLAHFARRERWSDDTVRTVRRRLSAFPNRTGPAGSSK
jgi:hypothetical protein